MVFTGDINSPYSYCDSERDNGFFQFTPEEEKRLQSNSWACRGDREDKNWYENFKADCLRLKKIRSQNKAA
jgi:hypothetical protein